MNDMLFPSLIWASVPVISCYVEDIYTPMCFISNYGRFHVESELL